MINFDYTPVRNPVRKKKGTYCGYFPSTKMNRMIGYESTLELDAICLFEADPFVQAYCEQPKQVTYTRHQRSHTNTVDFVTLRDGVEEFFEVKPYERLENKETEAIYAAVGEVYREQGHYYKLFTEFEIRQEPRLPNSKELLRYVRVPVTEDHKVIARDYLAPGHEVTIKELSSYLPMPIVYALIWAGYLIIDHSEKLTSASFVSLSTAAEG
ncbi:TnsA endonuclease N-terminal domain-containing protein [uncultured Kiloniella sp.]|uniref:TnsA endonuclease N-terminal domain-containing protein n=1 Tax=uncultured Kiloniella sp. TaxID=1133091 RepID=UPI00262BFCB8|nr:TnsA endonuclease N-terminal domain-containing protein [uncultured Kiloniella sp.]